MTFQRIAYLTLCGVLLPMLAVPASARGIASQLAESYPAGSIRSVAQAEDALSRVPQAYADIGRQFADDKAACHDRFLMSACLADVQQRQRDARSAVRKVEVEARAFLRKEKAAERDRAVAERESRAGGEGGRAIPLSGATREGSEPDLPKAGDE